MDYNQITLDEIITQFRKRIGNNAVFQKLTESQIFDLFISFMSEICDLTNFYMQRTAEERTLSTSKIESNVIKHCQNLGYEPRRPIPAQAELIIKLKGPFPDAIDQPGTEIFFSQANVDLSFNNHKYKLDSGYSYVLTAEDIAYCHEADWEKNLVAAVPHNNSVFMPLQGINYVNMDNLTPIKCFQGEEKVWVLAGSSNLAKLGKHGQTYTIDDTTFSNWYGKRDPYAYNGDRNFVQKNSWCKVGIGKTQDDAFDNDSLFDVETQAIKLNKKYRKLDKKATNELYKKLHDVIMHQTKYDKKYKENLLKDIIATELRICHISTNPDKTVRLNFGSDYCVVNGLMRESDNLFVKYISTAGKAANQIDVIGAKMDNANQVYASSNGTIINITSNIEFVLNSNIYGGDDFETMDSMKINGPAYYRRRNKLIMIEDFQNYFSTLTAPMYVNTAYVAGQQEVEDNQDTNIELPLTQNYILYTLLGKVYMQNNGDWSPRNVLTIADNLADPFSLYGGDYTSHICDYIKWLYSPNAYYLEQYSTQPKEQWIKMVQLIRENCKDNLPMNTVLLSMPPFIQYFDLVGNVNIKPTADLLEYNTRLKNKVYDFLNTSSKTTPKVYKSDIIKIYTDDPDTLSVDLDIKVSSLIKAAENKYEWSIKDNTGNQYVYLDKTLDSYTDELTSAGTKVLSTAIYQQHPFNVIKLPVSDSSGKKLIEGLLNDQRITINIVYGTNTTSSYTVSCPVYQITDESDNLDYMFFELKAVYPNNNSQNTISKIQLVIATDNDFASTSQFGATNYSSYKIQGSWNNSKDAVDSVIGDLNNWLGNLRITKGADRAIDLPYKVKITNTDYSRIEEIERHGNVIGIPEKTLSEHSFWTYFAKNVLQKYYSEINNDTLLNDELWQGASQLLYDLYALVKPGICDSILDDNNNIVNFSTNMEASVLINKISVNQK